MRYRNPYQTRHTYASMMLTKVENIMWVAKQMGHANVETVIKYYGRWLPDTSITAGYKLVHNWSNHLPVKAVNRVVNGPVVGPLEKKIEFFDEKLVINQTLNMASPRGVEPLLPP